MLRALPEQIRSQIRAGATGRSTALIAVLASVFFLGSWAAIHQGFYTEDRIVDTPLYQHYGDWMLEGDVPYRDFSVEYPPLALPVFVLPAVGNSERTDLDSVSSRRYELRGEYRRNFEVLMAICGLGAIVLAGICMWRLGRSNGAIAGGLGLVALAPLMLGSVFLSRFDLWPALLVVGAVTAIVFGFDRVGFGLLGAGAAAKVFPLVLLPIAAVWVWKRRGWREFTLCLGIFSAVVGACFAPFLIVSPGGVADALSEQLNRPLQIESLGAAALVGIHDLIGIGLTMESGSGSQNLAGGGADIVAAAQSALQALGLLGVWLWFAWAGEAERERFVRASVAAVVVFVALGKVLSPQYLIWLCPLVVLVQGRRGLAASALLGLSLILTQLWFPYRYWDYVLDFDVLPTVLVVTRDLLLLGILAVLLFELRPGEQEAPALAAEPAG